MLLENTLYTTISSNAKVWKIPASVLFIPLTVCVYKEIFNPRKYKHHSIFISGRRTIQQDEGACPNGVPWTHWYGNSPQSQHRKLWECATSQVESDWKTKVLIDQDNVK